MQRVYLREDHIMAARVKYGWQSDKTLEECMRYMLDNGIATDVCFEVGPAFGQTVTFRAHKYMLIARSPIFEAMLSVGTAENGIGPDAKIRINDIEAAVFQEVLNYIYYESVSICHGSAEELIYAGKMYMLPKLVKECRRWFLQSLSVNNVFDILELSLRLGDMPLKRKCLKVISFNADAVFTGSAILFTSRQVMEAILEADVIPVKEWVIYETMVKWAERQIERLMLPVESPTDLQIRDMLGVLLYKIRFPVMKPMEFAEISRGRDVLTAEEKESIYYFLVTKRDRFLLTFPTAERRLPRELWFCPSWISAGRTMDDAMDRLLRWISGLIKAFWENFRSFIFHVELRDRA